MSCPRENSALVSQGWIMLLCTAVRKPIRTQLPCLANGETERWREKKLYLEQRVQETTGMRIQLASSLFQCFGFFSTIQGCNTRMCTHTRMCEWFGKRHLEITKFLVLFSGLDVVPKTKWLLVQFLATAHVVRAHA